MANSVREPIQVYLSGEERDVLDRAASALGVSRSEVLRRGLKYVGGAGGRVTSRPEMRDHITPATAGPGSPPPSIPVAPFAEIMKALTDDRADR